ncbi:MAG: AAA family ATPase [Sulfurimonas sp.]|nr:AAA family ATPase [Sulfurimonas sp.]
MNNFYNDTGSVIKSKSRYVPRDQENIIKSIFLNKNISISVGITGPHKIGKTTLLMQNLNLEEEILLKNSILHIYIYLASYTTADEFFNDIVYKIFETLEDNEISLHSLISKKYLKFYEKKTKENREALFRILAKKLTYKIIISIDEFDKAITLFKYNSHYFQILRNFPSEFNISVLYISRRDIYYIEEQSPVNSTFANSFEGHYFLSTYSDAELRNYFQKLLDFFDITEEIKEEYSAITGNYPYLMDLLSNQIMKQGYQKHLTKEDIRKVYKKNITVFHHQFKEIKKILIEENIYSELLSIVLENKNQDPNKKFFCLNMVF